ncbi:undecaprenyl-diphosphate phosphatase [Thermodesulfovibrio yellowstonii]|jgi:undecaprenyl-diphosphatase|uniref:Undecaprenyl-diphosphatase n=1 Tax=Thermodesulfovibrio yellowstonii (strain ATCC 51303 / DSM 11347 / YP87) TaxID=289376 RepID=UPPP_THEYD|nr:undecaprenyl-diphosphate phosphatase [Thermodesulfovibrio yellowstonii]B5YID8.1 RecName: Full=Undecaprenyl-diphosphatase; AltName: Full=Bacitracin resistance protein; AltName: Full=Undecaprenyl pyrophosphate phosphatase [Thermodesulfovibrio yellowstonii DSM 11347]ACI22011.1 undecaprenol kinase, putative [Thermodesulfovibrio yellowstonii DSM 11347]
MDELFKAIILGIIQGITEFLPISSTAHLVITPWIFGWSGIVNSLSFDIAVHVGTLISLLYCFWKDWINIFFRERKMLLFIIIGTIPAGIAGIAFHDLIESALRHPLIIVVTLILVGFLMLYAEKVGKKLIRSITLSDAVVIGTAQAIALIPGVSRSGITITAGLFKGLDRAYAAKFSFLLSTPAIAGAAMLDFYKSIKIGHSHDYSLFIIGVISAAITGIIAIKFLLSFLQKYPLNLFIYYRWFLAVVIFLLYFFRN